MNEPVWVEEADCLSFHEKLLARFGGAAGLRDRGLLLSALARPKQLFAYEKPTMFSLAAAWDTLPCRGSRGLRSTGAVDHVGCAAEVQWITWAAQHRRSACDAPFSLRRLTTLPCSGCDVLRSRVQCLPAKKLTLAEYWGARGSSRVVSDHCQP